MARTKTVSQNMALLSTIYNSTDAAADIHSFCFLNLTSLDFSWGQNKSDIITYGKLASRERTSIESPEVNLNISYYLGGGMNEACLGLNSWSYSEQSALKYLLDGQKSDKNYYVFIAPEGADAEGLSGATSGIGVVGIGNGFLNSYAIEATIGDFPTVSASIQGLNLKTYTGGQNQPVPSVNPSDGSEITGRFFTITTIESNESLSVSAGLPVSLFEPYVLKPGDITLSLSTAGGLFYDYSTADVQSFRVGFDLNRQPLEKIGSKYSISREIQYPINVNFETTMITKDLSVSSLSNFLCNTGNYNAEINFNYTSCTGNAPSAFKITLRNISLEGQSWSTQAGSDPQTVTTTWVGQIGGSGDLSNGLFLSGYAAHTLYAALTS